MYSAAIIGLGNIGMGYDYACTDNSLIITHASAFQHHPDFALTAGVDVDPVKQELFETKFNKRAYNSVKELFVNETPEVLSISVPTEYHHLLFKEVIQQGPVAIILEKPISDNLQNAVTMIEEASKNNVAVLVNYMRRFEPGARRVKELIASGELGDVNKGVVWYSKGILNNGSHFIDLLMFIFGIPEEINILRRGRLWNGADPEPDVLMKFGNADIYLLAGREEFFSVAEMELRGSKGKLAYKNGGSVIEFYSCVSDSTYPGYTILSEKPITIPNDMARSQYHVLDNLADFLHGKISRLDSDGTSALETLKVIEQIKCKL